MKISFIKTFVALLFFSQATFFANAQSNDADHATDNKYINWHNQDEATSDVKGVSTERAYEELKGKPSRTVIVAVIDGGVDTAHEDLKSKIWTNAKEIPGNGIDDDHNGYVDDVHGWNFIGGAKGNVKYETMEATRLFKKYSERFKNRTEKDIASSEKEDWKIWKRVEADYQKQYLEAKVQSMSLDKFLERYRDAQKEVREELGKDDYSVDELKALEADADSAKKKSIHMLISLKENDFTEDAIKEAKEHYTSQLDYQLNPDYNIRATIVGDNPEDINDKNYGNNDVTGPNAGHGTGVAGIIGAVRKNGIGMDGVADNIIIMPVRAVPDGDERDKDVALAIRYAVDNGAQIINMSFGKYFSPQKKFVDDAIEYARTKNVLLIHAAGNESKDIDEDFHYPTNVLLNGTKEPNWMDIGATDQKADETLVAVFSNYGRKTVDVFAPGVNIYTCEPGSKYQTGSGTSFASPVTTGVAAMLMSYFPSLTIYDVKKILMDSSTHYKVKVNVPTDGEDEKPSTKKFKKLSVSGGVVNAYNAVKMAEKMSASK